MSRIGRMPVALPAGVTVEVKDGKMVVKGPKGTLEQDIDARIALSVENGHAVLTRANDSKELKAKHGLYRALLHNMVTGVTAGYTKGLVINGVGYKVAKQGSKIVLNIGFSASRRVPGDRRHQARLPHADGDHRFGHRQSQSRADRREHPLAARTRALPRLRHSLQRRSDRAQGRQDGGQIKERNT